MVARVKNDKTHSVPLITTPTRVLVVEDDADMRSALCIQLQNSGAEVVLIGEGKNVPAMIQKSRPNVIILDLGLPGINGFQVLERVAKLYPELLRSIIVVSAWDESENKDRVYEAGARYYFQKPVSFRALQAAIDEIVGG